MTFLDVLRRLTALNAKNDLVIWIRHCRTFLFSNNFQKQVQEAYEAVRDVKSTGATNQPKRPFRQRNEQTEQNQQRDPGMDHEHNWQQRMKIRQEWERQGRERKDRERKRLPRSRF